MIVSGSIDTIYLIVSMVGEAEKLTTINKKPKN